MIRLLVADDHRMFRQGLARLLADDPGLVVAVEASTSAEVIDALRTHEVDVAIIDLSMPGRGGIDLIGHIKARVPSPRVLVITMHGEEPYITHALRAGADGYLTKENAADEVVAAIHRVAGGGRYVCSTVAERLALGIATHDDGDRPHALLSEREYKVFEMLVAGRRGLEIARELSLSEKTVSTHKANVLKKMNMLNRTELVLYAIKHQLVAFPDAGVQKV
jgi:two-component system, NarL family, invasion response regulator UvrY